MYFALLAFLQPLRLLIVLAIHLLHLLLLPPLHLILPRLVGSLPSHSLLFVFLTLHHSLALGILLLAHSVELLLMFLLQPRVDGRAV